MRNTSTGNGKVVVNRPMSVDGFIAGPGNAMDWVFDFMAPDEFPDIAAMLVGRRTYEVGKQGTEHCRYCSATASASRPRASRGQIWNRSAASGRGPSPSSGSASASK